MIIKIKKRVCIIKVRVSNYPFFKIVAENAAFKAEKGKKTNI